MLHKLKFRVLPERLAVCRTAANAAIPHWATHDNFSCVVRTPEELSIVCPEASLPRECSALIAEKGWRAMQLEGPFPFEMTGVLASFVQPLAEATIPIFAISTFNTDYVLVKEEDLGQALAVLIGIGHASV